jgi:hypothetical protein
VILVQLIPVLQVVYVLQILSHVVLAMDAAQADALIQVIMIVHSVLQIVSVMMGMYAQIMFVLEVHALILQ